MSDFIQLIIAGLSSGAIYGIVALAFTLIYNSTQIVNFSQGEFVMLGAMGAYFLSKVLMLPPAATLVLVPILVGSVGFLLKALVVDQLSSRRAPLFSIIIATLAVGIVLSQSAANGIGKTKYPVDPLISAGPDPLHFGIFSIWPQNLLIIVIALIGVVLMWLFLNKTDVGLAIQAVGYNPEQASLLGIKVPGLVALTFILSGVVSSVGGVLVAPIVGASAYMGLSLSVKGFAAAILGGMGNPFAGVVGGIVLGIAESLASYYISSAWSQTLAYIILLVMLAVKPSGLFGERGAEA